jgi:hypothetical protein
MQLESKVQVGVAELRGAVGKPKAPVFFNNKYDVDVGQVSNREGGEAGKTRERTAEHPCLDLQLAKCETAAAIITSDNSPRPQ